MNIFGLGLLVVVFLGCRTTREAGPTNFYTVDETNEGLLTRPELCAQKNGTWKGDQCILPSSASESSGSSPKTSASNPGACPNQSEPVWNGDKCISSSSPKNFYIFCKDPNATEDIKTTVSALTKLLTKTDCETAYSELKKRPELDLSNSEILSLEPLSGLANVAALKLSGNKLVDLSPLKSLSQNLIFLDLSGNASLADLSAISSLSNLQKLYLNNTQAKDLSPLQSLGLVEFEASGTPISEGSIPRTEGVCPNRNAVSQVLRSFCQ